MNETSIDLALIWRLVRRRKTLLLLLLVVGAALGAASSFVLSPGYTSTTKVLLQGDRGVSEVPGEVQIATSLVVLNHTADDLQWGVTGAQLQGSVTANIADGNVLAISGSAPTPEMARQLADKATTEYVNFSNQIISDTANASANTTQKATAAIQQRIDDTTKEILQLQTSPALNAPGPEGDQVRAQLQQWQRAVTDATKQLEQLNSTSTTSALDATLRGATARLIEPATLPESRTSPTLVQLVLGGAAGFVILGVIAHLIALRTDRRMRRAQDMASVFGAPVLGVVGTDTRQPPPSSLIRRILHDDRRWAYHGLPVVDDARGRDARYHRLLRRLTATDDTPAEILAVVPIGDAAARGAVLDLALTAAVGPLPVALVTDDDEWAEQAQVAADERGVARLTAGAAVPDPGTALTFVVAPVSPDQPVLPELGETDGALLFVAVGTRTGWELAGIAGACADAGLLALGLVAVVPNDEGTGKADAAMALEPADKTLTGSA
jgi:capsular polysaccharide biosynthesis protein